MKLNVSSIRQRLHKLEQYIAELEKQQATTLETFANHSAHWVHLER